MYISWLKKQRDMLRKEGNKIILCCGGKACPKLSINENNNVVIEDDDGNTVVITKAQASLISQALDQVS